MNYNLSHIEVDKCIFDICLGTLLCWAEGCFDAVARWRPSNANFHLVAKK